MPRKIVSCVLLAMMSLGFCILINAAAEPIVPLEERTEQELLFTENVIGVTRRSENTYEAAANVTVIPGKFLERYAIRNINDLFEVLEGGWHTHKGMDEVLALRGVIGYANDKILFLYDGMLFPTFLGLGENNWPAGNMDDVEKIEIVKGPNTSVWGGQGTQGTINIVHKDGQQFQGLKTTIVVGKYGMARYGMNYAQKPTDDLSYQLYVNSVYYKGFYRNVKEWWGANVSNFDAHDSVNPLPDYEVFANVNYKDIILAYRRLESRTGRPDKDHANEEFIENYADDVNIVLKKPGYWKNTDWTTTVRFNNFYQMYDVFHFGDDSTNGYEMKTEKRYEVDTNVLMTPAEKLSLVLGIQSGIWSPQGSGPSVIWGNNIKNWDPNVPGSGNIYDPPEFLPTFTEMANDIADVELYVDAKYQLLDNLILSGGGRYVGEFNPGDQFRDAREKLHQFFPKAAVVYNPMGNLYLKGIYQTSFTRLNTFERYSEQNNIGIRGTQKATTSESSEFVVDWKPVKNMKALVSYYKAQLYDFANFIYTGTAWPTIASGDVRGFYNMGDQFVSGVEANVSYDWKNFGGFISGSKLLRNQVKNLNNILFGSGSGVVNKNDVPMGSWNSDPDVENKFNRAAVPQVDIIIGLYCDITKNYSVSGIWKSHQKILVRHEEFWADYYHPGVFSGGATIDLVATAKNVGLKNLNLSIIGKNITDKLFWNSSAMDPGHFYDSAPIEYEVKASYLW